MTNFTTPAAACWAMLLLISGCSSSSRGVSAEGQSARGGDHTIRVRLETSMGNLEVELDPVRAPISTGNFLNHARKGHYDGTIFHRVIEGFVVQGGGFNPDLTDRGRIARDQGQPDDPIINEWTNGLKNLRGTIAMARDAEPDTATREFYFNLVDNAKLDAPREKTGNAGYAVFGRMVSGFEVLDVIRTVPTRARPDLMPEEGGMKDIPVLPVVLRRVSIVSAAR